MSRTPLPAASVQDTLSVLSEVLIPTVAKGPIIRRPRVVALTERLDLDAKAVRRMQWLRATYGPGPLMLRVPGQPRAVILDPEHVHRVLNGSPEPFSTASFEKRAALSHFEPKGALITRGPARPDRRRFNEAVLDHESPMHRLSEQLLAVVAEEADELLKEVRRRRYELGWETFFAAWFRLVRRVVFGDRARNDTKLTDMIFRLRADANWAFLKPKNKGLRRRFFRRMHRYLARAEPGSLAHVMAHTYTTRQTAPDHQVPQWLFAFDPAGMTTFRSLALLASFPEQAERARAEVRESLAQPVLPFLQATVLESLRLWPTTPMVLRQSSRETQWEAGTMPAETGILIYAPFFHRDETRLPYAHRFAPEVWLEHGFSQPWPLIPFSQGPAICPGRHLVLMLSSNMLAHLITGREVWLQPLNRLGVPGPLPGTLNNYDLRFELSR
jgi:cytochrome P450